MPIPSLTEMELYCSYKKALIRTICRTNQWSGITEGEVNDWLFHNFKDIEGRYFAIKILLHGLYYSENNLVELLRDGIYNKIIGQEIKAELLSKNNIHIPHSETEAEVIKRLKKTLFVPLSVSNKPSESGNAIIRYLNSKLGIASSNTYFYYNINLDNLSSYEKIIVVDDCLGSGNQIKNFWNYNPEVQKLKEKAMEAGVSFYYLLLIGNEDALSSLQINGDLLGLRVIMCDRLQQENRVFNLSNTIWNGDNEELQAAITYFDKVESIFSVPRLGYGKLDFAVFIHNSTPDWSLPIFWTENSDWKPLFKRKNSNVV